ALPEAVGAQVLLDVRPVNLDCKLVALRLDRDVRPLLAEVAGRRHGGEDRRHAVDDLDELDHHPAGDRAGVVGRRTAGEVLAADEELDRLQGVDKQVAGEGEIRGHEAAVPEPRRLVARAGDRERLNAGGLLLISYADGAGCAAGPLLPVARE